MQNTTSPSRSTGPSSSSRSGGWFQQGRSSQPSRVQQPSAPHGSVQQSPSAPASGSGSHAGVRVDFELRRRRELLSSGAVFDLLKRFLPQVFPLARAGRGCVSVTFQSEPARQVRAQLSELGFSWNYELRCWQHPCGRFGSPQPQRA
jgi:hypothetical protein